jgi:DNA-binding beta-propeller fold protein YncE
LVGREAPAQLVGPEGAVVVANRGSGSISVIDVESSEVHHVPLPMAPPDAFPEPMYVNYSAIHDLVLVGDRANDRVVAFNASDYSVRTTIPAGDGIWHMSSDDNRNQLWVANEIDKSITVINLTSLAVETTFDTPGDLSDDFGGRPHDVFLDPVAPFGYVSMIGVDDQQNPSRHYVVAFSTTTFTETDRAIVGDGPHLSLSAAPPMQDLLFVAVQGADEVVVLDRATLDAAPGSPVAIPNAHGANLTALGDFFYTTNITGGGTDALFAIDTATFALAGAGTPDDTSFASPHNIGFSPDNDRLYVTHSGPAATKISIFDISNPIDPLLVGSVDAQLNPFGIATVPAGVPEPAASLVALSCAGGLLALRLRGRMTINRG